MSGRSHRTLLQDGDPFGLADGSRWILHPRQVTYGSRDQAMYDAVLFGREKSLGDLQVGSHDCDVIGRVPRKVT